MIAEDLNSKEIGEKLGIRPKTVEFHRGMLRRKLGLAGTVGLVRFAIRNGLVEP